MPNKTCIKHRWNNNNECIKCHAILVGGKINHRIVEERLEYLRTQIKNECISYNEIAELQSLAKHIDKDDNLLLEWAGVPEFDNDETKEKIKTFRIGIFEEQAGYINIKAETENEAEAITTDLLDTYGIDELPKKYNYDQTHRAYNITS